MKELIVRFIILLLAAAALAAVCFNLINREEPVRADLSALSPGYITTAPPNGDSTNIITGIYITEPDIDIDLTETLPQETQETGSETQTQTEAETQKETRPIVTSRAGREYDANSVYIDMANILQLPELPTGCEITALAIVLKHYGFNIDKSELARNYLPIGHGWRATSADGRRLGDSFFDYFIGDPFGRGYGCFANAIEKAANAFLADYAPGGGYTVLNISGSEPDALYSYVAAGIPVICWGTNGMIEPEFWESWYCYATDEQLDWYIHMHAFVLAGFDMAAGTITLNDPAKGIINFDKARFELRYKQMYSQAIVIIKD